MPLGIILCLFWHNIMPIFTSLRFSKFLDFSQLLKIPRFFLAFKNYQICKILRFSKFLDLQNSQIFKLFNLNSRLQFEKFQTFFFVHLRIDRANLCFDQQSTQKGLHKNCIKQAFFQIICYHKILTQNTKQRRQRWSIKNGSFSIRQFRSQLHTKSC